jgi:hypothetical protein
MLKTKGKMKPRRESSIPRHGEVGGGGVENETVMLYI